MKKILMLLTWHMAMPVNGQICIRSAIQDDLPYLIDLDRKVSLEHFVPLVPQYYTEYFTSQDYIDRLTAEVERDRELFQKGIDHSDIWRVHVAIDEQSNELIGYVLHVKNDTTLKLEFIAVDGNWRRQGIGSQLIKAARVAFSNVSVCEAEPLQCDRIACCFFENLGFINTGPGPANVMNVFGFSCDKWYFAYQLTSFGISNI